MQLIKSNLKLPNEKGNYNIPSILQPAAYIKQPKDMEDIFVFQNKIKLLLKHLGLNEVINYSMISKKQIEDFNFDPKKHLRLANTLSLDIEYLRTTLKPSLYKNIKDNLGKKDILRFFEMGKVYQEINNDLPNEIYKLGIATNTDYSDIKGIVKAVYNELNITLTVDELILEKNGIFMTEIDLLKLINNSKSFPKYKNLTPYAIIKLDKTFEISPQTTYAVVRQKAFQSKLLQKIEVVSLFENKLSLRFYYSSSDHNITEDDAIKELNIV